MIPAGTLPTPTQPVVPSALPLGPEGRLYLLTRLQADLVCEIPVSPASWRVAYGEAADYQTVVNFGGVLAPVGGAA